MNKISTLTFIALAALGLSACGGGGGAGPVIEITNPAPPVENPQPPVEPPVITPNPPIVTPEPPVVTPEPPAVTPEPEGPTPQEIYDAAYNYSISVGETRYQASFFAGLAGSHARGWDGEGVTIAVIDGFEGVSSNHGETVSVITRATAPGATVNEINIADDEVVIDIELADWTILRTANVVNHSYTVPYNSLLNAIIADGLESSNEVIGLQVVAAGNQSVRDLNFDGIPVAQLFIDYDIDTIVVGSINPEGTGLIHYSNVAGDLANHYITAPEMVPGGTSYAAPVVTGTAALIMDKFDNVDPAATKAIIFRTADDLGAPGVDRVYGHGRLNIGRALSPVGNLR